MARLIAVQLETCHHNPDGTAWYAYYDGELEANDDDSVWKAEIEKAAEKDPGPLGLEFTDEGPEDAPSPLSIAAGLRRYFVALAV